MYNHCFVISFSKVPNQDSKWFCQEKICANKYGAVSKNLYEALDYDPHSEIKAFYTDFSKAFDEVPYYELIQK